MATDTETLRATLATLNREFTRLQSELDSLPKTEGELKELLIELAAAADYKSSHFARFPRTPGNEDPYASAVSDAQTVRDDWTLAHSRFEKAVFRLTAYARTLTA